MIKQLVKEVLKIEPAADLLCKKRGEILQEEIAKFQQRIKNDDAPVQLFVAEMLAQPLYGKLPSPHGGIDLKRDDKTEHEIGQYNGVKDVQEPKEQSRHVNSPLQSRLNFILQQ